MTKNVDWSNYASVYDVMADNNPAYQEILVRFREDLSKLNVAAGSIIADLGAGTGNFSLLLAQQFPQAVVHHVDSSPVMLELAQQKAAAAGIGNITFINSETDAYLARCEPLSTAVAVHALYALPSPAKTLVQLATKLNKNGWFITCDLGKTLDIADWSRYLFGSLCKRHGLLKTLEIFWRGRDVAKHNRHISSMQSKGVYWTHTPEGFASQLQQAGFSVQSQAVMYRGYSHYCACEITGT